MTSALDEMRQWDELLDKALNESAKQALIPSPVNVGQGFSVGLVIAASLTSVILNSMLLACLIIHKGRCVSGFDVLLASQLIINLLLTLFVEPWDIIAYLILDNGWPFGETFCYLTRFLSLCIPFMSSWNIAMITVHQLLALLFLNYKWIARSVDVSPKTTRMAVLTVPSAIIWIGNVVVHAPAVYSSATEIAHHTFSTLHVTMCTLEFLYDLLHSALGVFLLPFILGCLCLSAMLVLHRLKNQDIPYERDTSVDSSVSFQLGSTRGVDESTLDFYGGNESDEQPIVNGVPTHTTALSRSSQSHYVLQWPEISWETQRITIGLFALFTFFTGPSGVLALYAESRIKSHGIHSLSHVTQLTVIFSLLPLLQLLLEPILVLVVSRDLRGVLAKRNPVQNVHVAASALSSEGNGIAHIT